MTEEIKNTIVCPECGNALSINDLIARGNYDQCVWCGYVAGREA